MSAPLAIRLRCASWDELESLLERHIKRKRFFVRRETGAPAGTTVRISLTLPSGEAVLLVGQVVESRAAQSPPGMSLALDVPPELLERLDAALVAGRTPAAESAPGDQTLETEFDEVPGFAQAEADLADALAAELEALRLLSPLLVLGLESPSAPAVVAAAYAEAAARYAPGALGAGENPRVVELAAEITRVLTAARDALVPVARDEHESGFAHGAQDRTNPTALDSRMALNLDPPPLPPPPVAPALPIAPRPPQEMVMAPTPPVVTFQTLPSAATAAAPPRKLNADALFGDMSELQRAGHASRPLEGDIPAAMLEAERLLHGGHHAQAQAAYEAILAKDPSQRAAGVGRSLARGLSLAAAGDRPGAAAYFEAVLQVNPRHERAARELAAVRRATTENKRGLLAKLLGRS